MKEPNRERKNEIKYNISLDEDQKVAKRLIIENPIVIVTGRAGTGKSLVCAQTALNFLQTKQCNKILVCRAAVEVGKTLGFMPGGLDDKFNPYIEAFIDNLYDCYDKNKIDEFVKKGKIKGMPTQFIRGKTVGDIAVVEEAQNLDKTEMLAILTRLGKTGKIIINGDYQQNDTINKFTGLDYVIELSKQIDEIKWIDLNNYNHRHDLVSKILSLEYDRTTDTK